VRHLAGCILTRHEPKTPPRARFLTRENFFEQYTCKSARNYTGYCDEETEKLIERQSQELDVKKRLALVQRIQKKLEDDAARPMLSWRYDDYAHWPHAKNLIPRHNVYNYGRMQEVWLDRWIIEGGLDGPLRASPRNRLRRRSRRSNGGYFASGRVACSPA
jgi:hypothetical protein